MVNLGIMQGRLTPSNGRGIQFFPFGEWQKEFETAQEIGLREIEWIFDYEDYEKNPLWTEQGCMNICKVMEKTGVMVHSICWDYFMRRPFYKYSGMESEEMWEENRIIFQRLLNSMKAVGASLVEIPMVDHSSVRSEEEKDRAVDFLNWLCDEAAGQEITVGLETDFAPGIFTDFLNRIKKKNIASNYDSGNSSGLGYDAKEELLSLGSYVFNVHIKDRVKGNGTVRLGTGSADFDKVFGALKRIGYRGSFILQAARGQDGKEKETVREQMEFVEKYLKKYEIG